MARFRLVPEQSELRAEARSTLHRVLVHTTGLTGVLETLLDGEQLLLSPSTHVELATSRLRSGNGLVDGELQRRLDPGAHPMIRAEVVQAVVTSATGTLRVTGTLSFHGVTRTLDVEVTVSRGQRELLVVEGGRTIDMRDFALPPPSFLLFRMDPRVQVRARLVATLDDESPSEAPRG
jgi:polyisoprenoid-binding protein YceI